jgi:hypothetical protein
LTISKDGFWVKRESTVPPVGGKFFMVFDNKRFVHVIYLFLSEYVVSDFR